ncbi:cytochrome c-type biogenesis protein CcmE [Chitinophaga jiangningensis]|uniref:Cytochrome c-type biogenesis protein CcmE n=1 Tax=Chitinophaga jiangningensis TaxID=1419482 RepID=A0A1M7KZT1_9BACT|nr:cytochrome c maturation protein CcmE [Chitinophaga jiangningensis]SHM70919.1 cytochrome c-type biogenesis protein CcmE [Chitinophaga jiangningensis]
MKKTNIILLVVIAVAIGVIITMVGDFSTYETFATARQKEGKEFHVIGTLDTLQTMTYDPLKDANFFSFYVKDKKGETRKVVFNGAKPTDFEKAESVVLTGMMDGNDFHCSKILMKCPSKYKNDQVVLGKTEPANKPL